MNYVTGTTTFQIESSSAVSLGKFDGLHRGHRELMKHVLARKKEGLTPVIFTFEKNPTRMFQGLSGQNIMTNEERRDLLADAGIEELLECPFIPQISHMEPERFVKEVLVGQLHAAFVAVGEDFHFGFQRKGDCAMLKSLGKQYGFLVEVVKR